jgi:16S rRNA (cytidine1402-2'-O)-methyltransferase
MAGTLYLVATPIGNLEDITHRALRVLREVDLVACEDTRRTRVLLDHYGIKKKLLSYHEHNEKDRAPEIAALLEEGMSVALVSDAGTPGISDPGLRLVRLSAERAVSVVPIPGPTALIAALIATGLPTDQFYFGGFLPARSIQRQSRLMELRALRSTLVFYEAPHRLAQTLADMREVLGEREAAVVRELTKLHEEVVRGRLSDLMLRFNSENGARGEIVLVVDRNIIGDEETVENLTADVAARVAALENEGMDARSALKRAARELGLSRSEAYRRLTAARSRQKN